MLPAIRIEHDRRDLTITRIADNETLISLGWNERRKLHAVEYLLRRLGLKRESEDVRDFNLDTGRRAGLCGDRN